MLTSVSTIFHGGLCFIYTDQYDALMDNYTPQFHVARDLGIPNQILGRITSSFKCEKGTPDKFVNTTSFPSPLIMSNYGLTLFLSLP